MEGLEDRKATLNAHRDTFIKGLAPPWDDICCTILNFAPPCIEALSKHAETFFYRGTMVEGQRRRLLSLSLFSGTDPDSSFPLTSEEIDYLGQITLPLVSDWDVSPADLSSRLRDIIQVVVLRGG